MLDLSIIIVNYNVKEFLQNLIYSIERAVENISFEIIVIDNASSDGSIEMLKEKFPNVKLFANEKNIGFGAANNVGFENAKGKYFLIINPDVIVKEDTFSKMIEFMENNKDAGMAGCKVLNPDGTLQLACRRSFPGPWTSFTKVTGLSKLFPKSRLFAKYNLTFLDENKTYEVDAISGSFMFMRREVYEKIGGFDTRFFMYGEDLDLCFRAQQAGYKVFYYPETEIIHYKGESTKRSDIDETKKFYEAMRLFVKKHLSSSIFVGIILRLAITLRKAVAFLNVYKLIITAVLVDGALFAAALSFAEKVYRPGTWHGFPDDVKPWVFIIPAIVQILISATVGSYKKNSISILRILSSLIVGLIVLSSIPFFFKQFAFSRAALLITYGILIAILPLWRLLFRMFSGAGFGTKTEKMKTLIVGTEEDALQLSKKLISNVTSLFSVVGLISVQRGEIGKEIDGFKVVGSLENLKKIIDEEKIDRVIFPSENLEYGKIFSTVSACNESNVDFMVAGKELDFMVGKSNITVLDDIPFLKLEYNISKPSHKLIKILFDYSLSLLFLILYLPAFLWSAVSSKNSEFIIFILSIPSVLSGKKSIVGQFQIESVNELYVGKPGLTGLWFTESVDLKDGDEIKKLNIFYARNQNIWLDFEILGKAFSKMIFKVKPL
ncbi:MAG: glycosyltransferase [Chlorobi bacterium]|nr:glycosyltransferase [Chlorobiota bacterium]